MALPPVPSSTIHRTSSQSSLPNPANVPLPAPSTASRSGSSHDITAEDAGLPKARSRANSIGSQASVRRRSDSEAAARLAALHSSAKSDEPEPAVPLETTPLSEIRKAKLPENPESPAIMLGGRKPSHVPTEGDVLKARDEVRKEIDVEALDDAMTRARRDGVSEEAFAGHALMALHPEASRGVLASAKDFALRVGRNNDFASKPAKIAASVANVTARNFMSVGIPTFARQFLSHGFEAALQHYNVSAAGKATAGTLLGLGPALAAHAYGAYRDEKAGTATAVSRRSRAIMAATALAATAYELQSGAAPDNASLHMAFTAYTAMRDLLVQSNVRLDNANTEGLHSDWTRWGAMMLGYGLDQGIVNLCMSKLASPSGPGAYKAGTGVKEQLANAGARAFINLLGEIGEDLMFQSIPALRAKFFDKGVDQAPLDGRPEGSKVLADGNHTEPHTLELGIHSEGWKGGYVANGALGPWAVRTGILATTIALTGVTGKKLPEKFQELTSDFIVGGVNALLYEPFAEAGSGQPQPARITDVESARSSEDAAEHDTDIRLTRRHSGPDDAEA